MKKTIILMAVILAVCSCGGKNSEQAATAPAALSKVKVQTATRETVSQDQFYSSTVQAFAINNIAPQTAGRIFSISAEVGQFVTKGQILATMDETQLNQSKLKLMNSEAEYERLKSLVEKGGISKSDFDQTEMAYKVAKSSFDNLEMNTYLHSPIDGVVTARNYDQGDMYSMGQPIFTVQQIVPVKLLVPVSERDYTKVRTGDKADISADALPGKTFTGKIVRLYPMMDPVSHTFNVEVQVQNSKCELRPGMYANVSLNLGTSNSIVIPDAAIVKQQGSGIRTVFILKENGTVEQQNVELGLHLDGKYEVLSGIEEGQKVVVKGASTLRSGQEVEVIKEK